MTVPYVTGQVTLTFDSAAIVGIGTGWAIGLVKGGILTAEYNGGNSLHLSTVTDDTHATAATKWKGATGTYNYSISRDSALSSTTTALSDRIVALLTRLAESGALGGDPGIYYRWDTTTTDADPGEGLLRANNVSLASATQLFISKKNLSGNDVAAFIAAMDDSTSTIKGHIILLDPVTEDQAVVAVTGLTDATNYVKLAISTPAGVIAFSAGSPISVQFSRAGDLGNSLTAAQIHVATAKTTWADLDELGIASSTDAWALRRTTYAQLKVMLNGLYQPIDADLTALAGIGTAVSGDLIYASGAGTWARRTAGTDGHVLTVAGGSPTWAALSSSAVGTASAGLAYGAIGTYVFAHTLAVGFTEGATYAGSTLEPGGIVESGTSTAMTDDSDNGGGGATLLTKGGSALSGTWRAMSRVNNGSGSTRRRWGLFLRIS